VSNVEFHQATIDKLPLADASADCVISNCVINLAPDKRAVFREIARVLKPGGRVAISDIALKKPLPAEIGGNLLAYVGCIAGAITLEDYRAGLVEAGFGEVEIVDSKSDLNVYGKHADREAACCGSTAGACDADKEAFGQLFELMRKYNINDYAASVKVYAVKA
jgi:SAM-dependent methyltransferase